MIYKAHGLDAPWRKLSESFDTCDCHGATSSCLCLEFRNKVIFCQFTIHGELFLVHWKLRRIIFRFVEILFYCIMFVINNFSSNKLLQINIKWQKIPSDYSLHLIVRNDCKFHSSIINTDSSKFIHKNSNIAWNNKAYLLIAIAEFPIIFSNV